MGTMFTDAMLSTGVEPMTLAFLFIRLNTNVHVSEARTESRSNRMLRIMY